MGMLIFKICHPGNWESAQAQGEYQGSPKDEADGFLHFSTAEQLQGTLSRHYAGVDDLLLIAVESDDLGNPLRFEPSRDGALFPHLYSRLPVASVRWVQAIRRNSAGGFDLPSAVK